MRKEEEVKREAVKTLGEWIGFGSMMHLASKVWGEKDVNGGHFRVGPCAALTVPCGCESGCDWCQGCGWLTEKAKAAKERSGE